VQENNKEVLLVDAGDLLFRKYVGPFSEHEMKIVAQKASLIIESLNLMGYHALGIGDDDLSLGKDFLLEISKKAKFPFLSSNVVEEGTGKPLFQPYLVRTVQGFKIGIFSLLSPEVFSGPGDIRKKGLTIRSPVDVANQMVKQLQPQVDLILLLSHLGYTKDVELAQNVSGIHLIVGSHTGINLAYAPIIKSTILLQTGLKGMYAGRIDLTFSVKEPSFYNSQTKKSMEANLVNLKGRLAAPGLPEAEKNQVQRAREQAERVLEQMKGKNEYTNSLIPLTDEFKNHPDIQKLIEELASKYPEIEKPASAK
jgi:5'-nucleotidase / UDP-sugar diphosphatase